MSDDGLVSMLVSDLGPLSPFDRRVVETVAGLVARLEDARAVIAEQGAVIDGREHPACLTERTASAELRGWVKERPDLFGQRVHGSGGARGGQSLKEKFKVV